MRSELKDGALSYKQKMTNMIETAKTTKDEYYPLSDEMLCVVQTSKKCLIMIP